MADKNYIWKGPPTAIEVVNPPEKEGDPPIVLFEGVGVPDSPIAKSLPEDHPQVTAWLAFGLIREVETQPKSKTGKQESTNA